MIEVFDVNHNIIKCELLFIFEKDNKNFIVYKDEQDDIIASYYQKIDNKFIIIPIVDEDDFDIVDMELEKWWNKNG